MDKSISFLCDFGYESGYGHLFRSISIGEELFKLNKKKINIFLTSNKEKDIRIKDKFLGENIFNWIHLNSSENDQKSFEQNFSILLKKQNSNLLILDTRIFLSEFFFSNIKLDNISIVTIDDITEKRIYSDLCFYPPVDSVYKLNWENYKGKVFIGWKWIAIRKEFKKSLKIKKNYQNISLSNVDILLLTGASDPKGISLKVLEFLNQKIFNNINLSVVVGPANKNKKKIYELRNSYKYKIRIIEPNIDISKIMKKNHIVISTFGTTCYELAALSIPSIHICLDEDHLKSSKLFSDNKMSISLGKYDLITKEYFKKKISDFIEDKDGLLKIQESCKRNIDIYGSRNIANKIISLI